MNKTELKRSISRLTRLANIIMTVPDRLWNMETFGDKPKTKCKTACCVLGHAALDKEFNKAGLKWHCKSKDTGFNIYYTKSKTHNNLYDVATYDDAGREFFGLTDAESNKLFSDLSASPVTKVKQIARLIRSRVEALEALA